MATASSKAVADKRRLEMLLNMDDSDDDNEDLVTPTCDPVDKSPSFPEVYGSIGTADSSTVTTTATTTADGPPPQWGEVVDAVHVVENSCGDDIVEGSFSKAGRSGFTGRRARPMAYWNTMVARRGGQFREPRGRQ